MKLSTPYNKTCLFFVFLIFLTSFSSFAQRVNDEIIKNIRKNHLPGDAYQYEKYIKKLEYDYQKEHPAQNKRIVNYEEYQSQLNNNEAGKVIAISKSELFNALESVKFSMEPPSTGTLSFLRTAAEGEKVDISYTKILQNKVRQDYDVVTESFKNSQLTAYKYVDQYSTYTFEVFANENGNFIDTVRIEYREYNPLSEGQIIGSEEYTKVNGKLELVRISNDKEDDLIALNGTIYPPGYDMIRSFQYDDNSGKEYLSSENIKEQKGETTLNNSYWYYPSGTYSSKSERTTHKTLGEIYSLDENYASDGNIDNGSKRQSEFDNASLLLVRKFETWDVGLGSYFVNFQFVYTYDESGRLIAEVSDFIQSKSRYEYEWDQDTIMSTIYSHQNQNEELWALISKTSYTYKQDTTLTTSLDFNGTEWTNERNLGWYIYFNDDEGNRYEVHSLGSLGMEPYNYLDTTMNDLGNCQIFFAKHYEWDGLKYNLTSIQKHDYDEQCHRILSLTAHNGWGMKDESLWSEDVNYSLYANSVDQDISDGIDWDILSYTYFKANPEKPEGLYSELISYWGSGGFKFEEYVNAYKQTSDYIEYQLSKNAPPNEFTWWQKSFSEYIYDEDQNLSEIITKKAFNEDIPLDYHSKMFYKHNLNGIETKVNGDWDGTNFTLTDSLLFTYDEHGYLIEEKKLYYQQDQITSSYRILYNYTEGDLDEMCKITFSGDTLINDGSTLIEASIFGESPTYEWYNANNELIEKTNQIDITDEGTYHVDAFNGLCSNTDSIRIWNACELTVKGDTLIRRRRTRLKAMMDGNSTNYHWKNLSNNVVSPYQNIDIDKEGIYYISATNDESGCANTDTVTIWKFRPIRIFGDSLLRRGWALIEAYLEGNHDINFSWYNATGSIIGSSNSLRTSTPGEYKVIAKGNYTYGEANWRIMSEAELALDLNVDEIKLFPNPTSDYLKVQLSNPMSSSVRLMIIDLNGKIALSDTMLPGERSRQLNLLGMKPGVYILKIDAPKSSYFGKFVIE